MEQNTALIAQKEWEYSLYQTGTTYELVIPLATPSPGFDVFHTLTDEEIAGYESEGIAFLQGRIKDMGSNYLDYKVQAWR